MWRALIFLAVFCQIAQTAFVALSASTGALVEIDAAAYFSFAQHQADYLPMYLPARETCTQIFDAQFVQTDQTYRIDDWYYRPAAATEISSRVSIVDLEAFAARAYQVGVWTGAPDCDAVWTRLSALILSEVSSIVTQPIGSDLSATKYGITYSLYCGEAPCSPLLFTELLKVSPAPGVARLVK